MEANEEYIQAKTNLSDLQERGTDAIGGNVLEFIDEILTPEEIEESNLRSALIGNVINLRITKNS